MLRALTEDGEYVMAENANRKRCYFCPECEEAVTLKAGRIVVPHFAHKPPHHCEFGTGESARHHEMKALVGKYLASLDPEYEIALLDYRRADVVIVRRRLVVECQASKISVSEWEQRTRDYNGAGWAVMWIWDMKRLGTPKTDRYGLPSEYRVPDEMRYCHQESYGRVFLMAHKHLFAAHFYSNFRDGGDWPEATGYYPRTLRGLKRQELPDPLNPRRTRSASGLLLGGFGEGAWWKRSA